MYSTISFHDWISINWFVFGGRRLNSGGIQLNLVKVISPFTVPSPSPQYRNLFSAGRIYWFVFYYFLFIYLFITSFVFSLSQICPIQPKLILKQTRYWLNRNVNWTCEAPAELNSNHWNGFGLNKVLFHAALAKSLVQHHAQRVPSENLKAATNWSGAWTWCGKNSKLEPIWSWKAMQST